MGVPNGVDLESAGTLGERAGRPEGDSGGGCDPGQPGRRAEGADRGRLRAEDDQAGTGAGLGELGPVGAGHHAEPDPVGPRRHEGGDQVGDRYVAVLGLGQGQGLAGLASPPGPGPGHGAHRDGAKPLAAVGVELRARRGKHPQRGLATLDDGEPSHRPHAGVLGSNAA